MSNFVVSARKYRPMRFDEVVGQQHVSQTLKNALANNHLAHAFLFCGPRGVGKTTCARILAKVLNCETPTNYEPCNTCNSCQSFNENASFNITELDAASNNSVEHIRALIEQVRFQPQRGQFKVFIIDEVHMLSQQAFNAFLKTLEEPPPYAKFILATTEKHKIIPTILSRCQIFDFNRILIPDIIDHLQKICHEENIEADNDALHIIAQKADGALRDALSIFDRIISFSNKKVTYEDVITNLNVLDYDYFFKIVDGILIENISQILLVFDEILRKGFDPSLFINGLAEHFRNLLICQNPDTLSLLETGETLQNRYLQQARLTPSALLLSALAIANDCDVNFKMARNKRLHVEIALIRMAYIQQAVRASAFIQSNPNHSEEKKNPDSKENPIKSENTPNQIIPNEEKSSKVEEDPPSFEKKKNLIKGSFLTPKTVQLTSLEALDDEVTQENATDVPSEHLLNQSNLEKYWKLYAQGITSPSTKTSIEQATLTLKGEKVLVGVASNFAKESILGERNLVEYLKKELNAPTLTLEFDVTKTETQETPKKNAFLSPRDKYRLMRETNPTIDDLQKIFDLYPET